MLLLEASKLSVSSENDGLFGRMLGWLYKTDTDTMSINQIMIDKGYAWSYDGGTKEKNLDDLMAKRENSDGV